MKQSFLTFLLCFLLQICRVFSTDPSTDPFACSATKPCKIGCCGINNVCGLGPSYCAPANCTSSCDAKSDCDPGWGSQWSTVEACPLNVCCSKFGFCGTTPDFCGSATVKSPSCSSSTTNQRVVGYYEGWSNTRSCGGMFPENVPYGSYTHLNYAFALIDPSSFAVAPMADSDKDLYPRFTGLKQAYPGLQTWISIGGWSMNDPDQPTAKTFSQLAASSTAQNAFFQSLLKFMSTYGFDGVDIDWEYPVAPERSGSPADYANYVSFLKNLKGALGAAGHNYGLSITIPSSYWYMQHFDIVQISSIIDWFNVMSYDLHGTWDSTDPYIGPVVNAHTNLTEINQTLDLLWRNNIDPAKVTLGIGFYGRSFTLSDPSCTSAGCPFSAGGSPGPCTASAGTLSFSEIENVIAAGATVTLDSTAAVKIAVWNSNQWVSYDDADTLKLKVDYANSKCLGGVMVWAASTDDFQGNAAIALNKALGRDSFSTTQLAAQKAPTGQCVWGECSANPICDPGLSPAQRSDGKNQGNAGIYTGCPDGQQRNYCCPSNNVPTCQWRGTAPLCASAGCNSDEVVVATSTSGTGKSCWFNHKNLCCKSTATDSAASSCVWSGSAPICNPLALAGPAAYYASASCPSDHSNKLTTGKDGFGGDKPCWDNGGFKSFCCNAPVPYQNCQWYQQGHQWVDWILDFIPFSHRCVGECPTGKIPVAADSSGCWFGTTSYFCCDNPNQPPTPVDDNLCPIPNGVFPLSGTVDDDGDVQDLLEFALFEQDCFISGDVSSEDSSSPVAHDEFRRGLLRHDFDNFDNITVSLDLEASDLEKRGGRRLQQVCGPGPVRSASKNKFRSQPYPPVNRLLKGAIDVVSLAKPAACGAAGLLLGSAKEPGQKYVVEHVFELQSVSKFATSIARGILPGGGTLSVGPAPFNLFDVNGAFQSAWTALGITPPAVGSTMEETVYSVLGTSSDFSNLQICEAGLNGLKKTIWAGSKNIIGDFANLDHKTRVKALQDVVNVFKYLNLPGSQSALQASYNGMHSAWQVFQSAVSGRVTYDFVTAYKEWNTAQFQTMTQVSKDFILKYIDSEIAYWANSNGRTVLPIPRADAAQVLADLTNLKANLNSIISVTTNWIK